MRSNLKPEPEEQESKTFWAILEVSSWDCLKRADDTGAPVAILGDNVPTGFLPVFDSYEKALAWNNGEEEGILELES